MNQRQQSRSSSHGRKVQSSHGRPSKPPPLARRGNSSTHIYPRSSSISRKVGLGCSKRASTELVQQDEDELDMESFLQFCATCERQIVTPGGSILYCSEACRRSDSVSKPTTICTSHSPILAATTSYFDGHQIHDHTRDIIPQRSPTVLRPVSLTFSDLTLSESDSPTDEHTDHDRHNYFHSTLWSGERTLVHRQQKARNSTACDSSALPSLIHSPSSSVGTAASFASARHLPSRGNSAYCAFSQHKVIEPVSSYTKAGPSTSPQMTRDASLKSGASTLTSFRVVEAGAVSYEKRPARRDSGAQGSLKQLFSHEAMKTPPAPVAR